MNGRNPYSMILKLSLWLLMLAAATVPAHAEPPVLSLPPDDSSVGTLKPALVWDKLDDANVYVVSVFSDRRGKKRIAKFTVRGNSCMVDEGFLKRGKRYWWNVAPRRGSIMGKPSRLWSLVLL